MRSLHTYKVPPHTHTYTHTHITHTTHRTLFSRPYKPFYNQTQTLPPLTEVMYNKLRPFCPGK